MSRNVGVENRVVSFSKFLRTIAVPSRSALLGAGLFSSIINILALTSSIYMLQLYDRVLPSHSVPTLVGLSILMLVLFAGYGALDMLRARLMSRAGLEIDRSMRDRVHALVVALPLKTPRGSEALQPVRDLDQVRVFVSGAGPMALFDLPWMPFYIGLVFLLHPWLGALALGGAAALIGGTVLTDRRSRALINVNTRDGSARMAFAEASRKNAEVVAAMGMSKALAARWRRLSERNLHSQTGVSDVAATYGTISKILRYVLQSAVLALGAYLTINGQATGGVMIAASILTSRALAPVEVAIANWRAFLAAKAGAARLQKLFDLVPERSDYLQLPAPQTSLAVSGIQVAAPGGHTLIVQNVSFDLKAGSALGVVGPSASGKSTLARALVGLWAPVRGTVRLDGATLDQWDADTIGRHIGYLPQEISLFDGSIAENIARFDANAKAEDVLEAARLASIHDMIVAMPNGYETPIGEGGAALSAGQRQRLALARALYGRPFLVVLDEPNSNLDAEGDAALTLAIQAVRARGGIAVVIAHRPSALAGVDQLLVLANGLMQAFGPKEDVLRKVMAAGPPGPGHLKVVAETGATHG